MACVALVKRAGCARLQLEYLAWTLFPIPGFRVALVEGDLSKWRVVVPGLQGSFLHNTEYDTEWTFPFNFPFRPPRVKFVPPVFHPNVYPSGTVCSAILNEVEAYQSTYR